MSSYGRNFDFRVTPIPEHRLSRFFLSGSTDIPIGAPVKVTGTTPDSGRTEALPVVLATGDTAPLTGVMGLAVYEWIDLNQLDPQYYTYSDRDLVPHGRMLQVVHGNEVKVVFRNTADRSFFGQRDYAGRIMVAGAGATPTLAVGDMLTPGNGDDDNGYWKETSDAANAWFRVTLVDVARGEVEAEMLF